MCKCLWGTADKHIRINGSGSCLVRMCRGQMEGCLVLRRHSEPWLGTHSIRLTCHSATQELNDLGRPWDSQNLSFLIWKMRQRIPFSWSYCVDSTEWRRRLPPGIWVPWWIVFSLRTSLSCPVEHRTTHEVSGLKKKFGFFCLFVCLFFKIIQP